VADQREELHAARLSGLQAGEVMAAQQSIREQVMRELSAAQLALGKAYQLAITANSMAADLPLFQRVKVLQAEVSTIMQGVAKVRGL
jgi:hypothetical protein